MNRRIISFVFILIGVQWAVAQAPKWTEKAKKAVFSVITYDKDNKLLNTGNGFFVSEDGVALSDYSLFKNANRAVIITSEGKEMPVAKILGANEMYDVVKFAVGITERHAPALTIATRTPAVGEDIFLLPYSTQKNDVCATGKILEASKIASEYTYYKFGMGLKEKKLSCPVMTAEGEVFALAQRSTDKDSTTVCYGMSAPFAFNQAISGLSYNDQYLQRIGIPKALPDTEDQALVYLLLAGQQGDRAEYLSLLEEFIAKYPDSSDGYLRRAETYLSGNSKAFDKAEADYSKALSVAKKKDDVYFTQATAIYNFLLNNPDAKDKPWTYDKAEECMNKALAVDSLPVYVQQLGYICYAKKDFAKAYNCFTKVTRTNLASPATFYTAALCKEQMGDSVAVMALMDSCIARCGKPVVQSEAAFFFERGQRLALRGEYRKALADFDDFYAGINGQVTDNFYYQREQVAFKCRMYQRALDDINKAVEMNPKELTYQSELAAVNIRVGRYEEAIKVLQKEIITDPKYAEPYRLLGICQIMLKQKAEACVNFAKAKDLGDKLVDTLIDKYCK